VLVGEGYRILTPGSDEIGQVAVPGSTDSYFKDPEKTADTFRLIDGVRYTIPGDFATMGADGTLTLLGRGSQSINSAGEKIFPEEVEEVLKLHPAVEDALVFGVPDERFGQRVVAVVSLVEGVETVETDAIVQTGRAHLASFKLPRQIVITDVAPRTATGKPDYPAAREIFEAATSEVSGLP
jgi:fatty-acyl-CoA synthase